MRTWEVSYNGDKMVFVIAGSRMEAYDNAAEVLFEKGINFIMFGKATPCEW